jgi:hypothetical protein
MPKWPHISFENPANRARYWLTVGISCLPPNRSRSIFVLGYPRTGTNWLCTILNHYFGIPINEFWRRTLPDFRPTILHMHRFVIVPRRTIYMMRDPRDITVSLYHKMLASPGMEARRAAERYCVAPMVHENLRVNLPGYIEYLFSEPTPSTPPMHHHFRKARALGLHAVRYEDLLARGEETLTGIVEFLGDEAADRTRVLDTLDRTSFEKHTGRKRGEEDLGWVVARKGISGDWKNQFTVDAARAFDQAAGDLLVEFGYETDRGWAERFAGASDG